jgi:enoyl-CoA hydratase/carnithine racemase
MAYEQIKVSTEGHIATVELRRAPNNQVNVPMIGEIGEALEGFDRDKNIRAIVLCSDGKHFSAGADLVTRGPDGREIGAGRRHLYKEAIRLMRTGKPIVAAVQGAAVGAGLGLALVADFRVTCTEARFSANFTRLGFHPGFGLTATLPRLLGASKAALLMYTGRRIPGDEAVAMGLADVLVPLADVRKAAAELATEIAQSAPLAIIATRETLRRGLAEAFGAATEREFEEQDWLRKTADYQEGVKAMSERRLPKFVAD